MLAQDRHNKQKPNAAAERVLLLQRNRPTSSAPRNISRRRAFPARSLRVSRDAFKHSRSLALSRDAPKFARGVKSINKAGEKSPLELPIARRRTKGSIRLGIIESAVSQNNSTWPSATQGVGVISTVIVGDSVGRVRSSEGDEIRRIGS